ncbi:MAG: glycosyltransferase family 4 protein [Lentisphaerae bacterium]|nr:glycosyltransferase family 4 protein [Lentisphaerota bacterium]
MKIAYVLGTFPSISETFILREIIALREHGFQIFIFALGQHIGKLHQEASSFVGSTLYRRHMLSPLMLANQIRCAIANTRAYWKELRHFPPQRVFAAADFAQRAETMNIDHVHAHFAFGTADIGLIMARFLRVPFSLSLHAKDIFTQNCDILSKRISPVSFATVCTRHAFNHLRRLLPSEDAAKLVFIPHGLAPESYAPSASTQPIVLAIGRLEEKKGFRHLLEACKVLKEEGIVFRCVIAGAGSQMEMLQIEAQRNGINDRVVFPGEQTQNEVRQLLEQASVFVMPSVITANGDQDGIPNVVLEAMSMALPVVASALPAMSEAVTDGKTGYLVKPRDPIALANKIRGLLADRALRTRMGQAGRAHVIKQFDINRNINLLADLFEGKGTTGTLQ